MPSGFQEVEWIQSSGSQWINTAVNAVYNLVVDVSFLMVSHGGVVLSGGDEWANADVQIGCPSSVSEAGYYMGTNRSAYFRYYCPTNTNITIHMERPLSTKTTCSSGIYDIRYDDAQTAVYSNYPIAIFCYYRAGWDIGEYSRTRLYSLKFTNNGTVVRNYVPCYCTQTVTGYKGATAVSCASETIGLYDLANSRFYVNSGSGTFTKGADV